MELSNRFINIKNINFYFILVIILITESKPPRTDTMKSEELSEQTMLDEMVTHSVSSHFNLKNSDSENSELRKKRFSAIGKDRISSLQAHHFASSNQG
jgi:hypothetical protein